MEITLDMLLASRDKRQEEQASIRNSYPDKTLVCLTVIMPGRVKRNEESLVVAHAAIEAVIGLLGDDALLMEKDLPTGYEAYFVTSETLYDTKRMTCQLEEQHSLGRLFDIDVIDSDGSPVSRADIGLPPRRCLLCNQEARFCMRNHTHTPEEIQQHISQLIAAYNS